MGELATLLLLAVPFAGAWVVLSRIVRDARLGFALAGLAWASWAVAVAELVPVERAWVSAAWLLPALAACIVLWRARGDARGTLDAARAWWRACGWWHRGGWLALALVGALTLVTALVAAPNNWDSMTYHLARIAAWVELGDVVHYPTHIDPQLYQPPGAELLMLQSYVLAASDVLVALVQWGAWLGCVVLAHRAAQALGAGPDGRLAAALLVGTTPLAVLQASSTQNDLVLAFWLLLALTLAAMVWRAPGGRREAAWLLAAASLAVGMAVLTKGTGLMFGAPVGVLVAATAVRRMGAARAAALAVAGALLVALPSSGAWLRNYDTYGALVATDHAGLDNPYRVTDPGVGSLVSNLVRNATNHLDMPWDAANARIERWTVDGLGAIGIDANDPRTTFLGQGFRVGPFGPHEDHAGSALLLILGLWAAGSVVRARVRGESGSGIQAWWLGVMTAQVLLFCWLITWQNWHVRMHLPVTVAIAVLVGVRLAARGGRRLLVACCVVAAVAAPAYAALNVTRPLVGERSILTSSREEVRYSARPQLRASTEEVLGRIAQQHLGSVGLVSGVDDWEYPLMRALGERGTPWRSVLLRDGDLAGIDAVVCTSCTPESSEALRSAGFVSVALRAGGDRAGLGNDVSRVELWLR